MNKKSAGLGIALAAALPVASASGAATATFSNPTPITINDAVTSGAPVAASPSPSPVFVGLVPAKGGVTAVPRPTVSVTLYGVTHSSPADMVISVGGVLGSATLVQNAGGVTTPVSNATLTFGSSGPQIPFAGPMVTGLFAPSAYSSTGVLASGSWRLRYASGIESLSVVDDDPGDTGVIAGGFSVNVSYTPENVFTRGAIGVSKKGVASIPVNVPGPGLVEIVKGAQTAGTSLQATAKGTYKLSASTRRNLAKKLRKKGRARGTVKVKFTPTGGTASVQSFAVTFKKKLKKHKKHH